MSLVHETPDETQELIGDLEDLRDLFKGFLPELRRVIRRVMLNTHSKYTVDRPARAAADVACDFAIDGVLEGIAWEIKRAREEGDFDLTKELRRVARDAGNI